MQKERPLSPHLQVYRPQITMVLSITHRIMGAFLAVSIPFLIYWLMTVAAGPAAYASLQECLSHWFAKLVLLAWMFAIFYHLCNGIRHLFWDVGHGYEIETLYKSGYAVAGASIALTLITAYFAFFGGA